MKYTRAGASGSASRALALRVGLDGKRPHGAQWRTADRRPHRPARPHPRPARAALLRFIHDARQRDAFLPRHHRRGRGRGEALKPCTALVADPSPCARRSRRCLQPIAAMAGQGECLSAPPQEAAEGDRGVTGATDDIDIAASYSRQDTASVVPLLDALKARGVRSGSTRTSRRRALGRNHHPQHDAGRTGAVLRLAPRSTATAASTRSRRRATLRNLSSRFWWNRCGCRTISPTARPHAPDAQHGRCLRRGRGRSGRQR